MENLDNMFFTTNARSKYSTSICVHHPLLQSANQNRDLRHNFNCTNTGRFQLHFLFFHSSLTSQNSQINQVMMNEDGGDDLGSGNGCCSWLRIKKKKSSRVENPNIMVASSSEPHTVPNSEAGTLVISIDILRGIMNNFSDENILGQGGSGTVYKGELPNSVNIAVKRMKPEEISGMGASKFEAEMAVLKRASHSNLVLLLGYCLDGDEMLIVYENMGEGTLSRYLFYWKDNGLEPLMWNRRLSIALDVARGIEYLHSYAHQTFIHRDLKPSKILLGHNMRAKVAGFGLACLAPKENAPVETRIAGTLGYLAPEYAVTGHLTTKVDVFSFGVILMELITGRKAIDDSQPEDSMHIVPWFRRVHLNKDSLHKVIDPAIDLNDETLASIHTVAELAGHCSAEEPYQRPNMTHVVHVLLNLVDQWKPSDSNSEDI